MAAAATIVATGTALAAGGGGTGGPKAAPSPDTGSSSGASLYKNPPSLICANGPAGGQRAIDCEPGVGIHNETALAVNPADPDNLVASANDYQLKVSGGGGTQVTVFSRVRTSFDRGVSWTTYPVPYNGYTGTGDPSLAFDDVGTAYFATLAGGNVNSTDVVVSRSTDGGKTWSTPVVVAAGKRSFQGRPTIFHDHPVPTAWGSGNVYVTWVKYEYAPGGASITTAPVLGAVSHDAGVSWSKGANISGSAPFCTGLSAPNACDQTWGNAPAVSSTGTLLVTFYQTPEYRPDGSTNLARNTHMSVRVDPQTGQAIGPPVIIGLAYDGINEGDYPVNVDGRQTLHDSEFRLLIQGNIAADPTDATGRHFAVVWFDDRGATLPVNPDPYQAVTNSEIVVSQTTDAGSHWSEPQAIALARDQFFPWAAYGSDGRLRVGFFDRRYDSANHAYGYSLATESAPGSLAFTAAQVTNALSDPTTGSRWFRINVEDDFPAATRFIGDYSAIASAPYGTIAYWTDMRDTVCLGGSCGAGQATYVAVVP